jgi:class 3 adenylate cyclase
VPSSPPEPEVEAPGSRYVKTRDDVWIGYQVFGSGPYDLVLNDGWMGNLDANWDLREYRDSLTEFARRARVIMFDRRGFGISDRPCSPGQLAIEKGLDDMRAVMDAVGVERPIVFGSEAGAALSLIFCASHPDRVLGLVLHAPLVRYSPTADFPWGFPDPEADEWLHRIETQWGTREFARWHMNSLGLTDPTDRTLDDWARWYRLCASPAAALAIERAEREVDVRRILPNVRVPTLVMLKEGDLHPGQTWGAAPWVAEQIAGARYVELPGREHFITATDNQAFDDIERFAAQLRSEEAEFDRYLATVLFTDIVGSTDQAARLGDESWRQLVQRHHATVRAMLGRYRGTEIDTAGDGFFAAFDGPARAVRCAEHIVDAVRTLGLEVRAGVHTGEVHEVDGKVGGLAVSIGARVAGKAGPSEIMASQTVKDLTAGSGLTYEDAGVHELKGIPDRWHLYRVVTRERGNGQR